MRMLELEYSLKTRTPFEYFPVSLYIYQGQKCHETLSSLDTANNVHALMKQTITRRYLGVPLT